MNVLFIAPTYMDLYKDIINELINMGHQVDFIKEICRRDDPYNIRGLARYSKFLVNEKRFNNIIFKEWNRILNLEKYSKRYDFLFVLDGQSIRSIVFEILKLRNPQIKCVNYLFDTTYGVYRFDKNFQYFDKVYSFDIKECEKFNINFLPIYWVKVDDSIEFEFDIFGLGAIKNERFHLYERIEKIALSCGKSYFLKLYDYIQVNNFFLYKLRHFMYKLLGIKGIVSPKVLMSKYSTTESLSPSQFRKMIASCNIVIDTSAEHQDGLTARFMWALGLGKKIITTNCNVANYSFYSPEQIFIYSNNSDDNCLKQFINSHFSMTDSLYDFVNRYSITNWLNVILN